MEPDSNRLMFLPSLNVSVKAGMRPLGLILRNSGVFWSFFWRDMAWTVYGRPSSSRVIEIFTPLGVWAVFPLLVLWNWVLTGWSHIEMNVWALGGHYV